MDYGAFNELVEKLNEELVRVGINPTECTTASTQYGVRSTPSVLRNSELSFFIDYEGRFSARIFMPYTTYDGYYELIHKGCVKLKLLLPVTVYFNDKSYVHREDGPAFIMGETTQWFWEGFDGLDSFPDRILANIGDQVI